MIAILSFYLLLNVHTVVHVETCTAMHFCNGRIAEEAANTIWQSLDPYGIMHVADCDAVDNSTITVNRFDCNFGAFAYLMHNVQSVSFK